MSIDRSIACFEGSAAMPRKNGELIFEAPWEGRAFGLAVVMSEKGAFEWDEFRARLVAEISGGGGSYYESWLDAFQSLLTTSGVLTSDEVSKRAEEYATLERDPVF